jgi:capsular polysaccharide biosynthesis protein
MSRYGHTFWRFWWLLLIPILVLPAAEALNVRHTGSGFVASTNIYVEQTAASDAVASTNGYGSLAQIQAANIIQWLQSPTFCLKVAKSSPAYAKLLANLVDPKQSVTTDLQQNVSVTAEGDNLVSIAYSSQNPALALQVVQGVLTTAATSTQASTGRVSAVNRTYYQLLLQNSEATERNSARQLTSYMQQHGILASDVQTQIISDPTLATLYAQNTSDQQTVSDLRQKVMATLAQNSLPATLVNQTGYYVADPPAVTYVSASRKKQAVSVGIALLLALVLAGAFLVVMTAMDRTFRSPTDVPMLLDLPVLAVVPFSKMMKDTASRKQPEPAPNLNASSRARVS